VSLDPGTVVASDYRIVSPLAQGGMGEVYVAEQMSTGKRRALKLMKKDLVLVPGLLARFEQEAKIGARIESEHVVEVVGAGIDPTLGMPWLAMELLDGASLEAMIASRGAIPVAEARTIFAQVGHAVGAAHRAGVVHRDLKPENIFVAKAHQMGVSVRVKVLDFGISKLFEDAKSNNTGALSLGTPRYMAPEQTGGQPITPATDVWALGLIAYRTLTGRYYWRHGAGAAGDTVMMLMREILFEPLVPASRRATEQGVAHLLPPGFDGWFSRAVAREPSERFQNGDDATRALLEALGGAGTGVVPVLAGAVRVSKSTVDGPTLASPPPQGGSMSGGSMSGAQGASMHLGMPAGTPPTGSGPPVTIGGAAPPSTSLTRSRRGLVALALAGVGVAALGGVGGFLYLRASTAKKRRPRDEDESETESKSEPEKKKRRDDDPPKEKEKPRPPAADVSGAYDIVEGINPSALGGQRYAGTVVISNVGPTVRVEWHSGSSTFLGVGFVDGDELVVAFGAGSYGVGVYANEGGKIAGRAATSEAAGVIETQTLTGPPGFSGDYRIAGPSGPFGSAVLSPQAFDLVQIRGDIRTTAIIGTGIRRGERLVVGWGVPGGGGGVVVYKILSGVLEGIWAAHGTPGLGSERLRKR
jgi:serine/threonine protein kinase